MIVFKQSDLIPWILLFVCHKPNYCSSVIVTKNVTSTDYIVMQSTYWFDSFGNVARC